MILIYFKNEILNLFYLKQIEIIKQCLAVFKMHLSAILTCSIVGY